MSVVPLVGSALSVIDKLLDHIPNFDQRQAKKFRELREDYENEQKKPYGIRNDQYVLVLGDKLQRLLQKELPSGIPESSVASVRET